MDEDRGRVGKGNQGLRQGVGFHAVWLCDSFIHSFFSGTNGGGYVFHPSMVPV